MLTAVGRQVGSRGGGGKAEKRGERGWVFLERILARVIFHEPRSVHCRIKKHSGMRAKGTDSEKHGRTCNGDACSVIKVRNSLTNLFTSISHLTFHPSAVSPLSTKANSPHPASTSTKHLSFTVPPTPISAPSPSTTPINPSTTLPSNSTFLFSPTSCTFFLVEGKTKFLARLSIGIPTPADREG